MLSGTPNIFSFNPQTTSTTPLHQLGAKGVAADGRIYRYGQAASTGIATGKLCVAPAITTNHEDNAFASAGVVGATVLSITVGATEVAANEYVEGYLVVVDDTGEGHTHKIVRHETSTSGGEAVEFEIAGPGLAEATTTSTTVTLVRNPYKDVVIATGGTQTDIPVGVTPVAFAADEYGWFQTGGYAAVLTSGTNTATAGEPVTIGEATNGTVSGRDAVAEPLVGIAATTVNATNGEHNVYYLLIDR